MIYIRLSLDCSLFEMRKASEKIRLRMFGFSMLLALHLRCGADKGLHAHLALQSFIKTLLNIDFVKHPFSNLTNFDNMKPNFL